MKKFFNTKVKAVLALTVVLAVALALLGALGQGASLPQRIVQGIMTPLRSAMNDLTRHAEKLYSYIFRYEALEAENQALREQIAEMENDARTTDTLQRENQRLRELVGLKEERQDFELVASYIITWDSNDWTSSFTIDKGTGSGIQEDMVAITAQGEVVGLVTAAGSNWATVTTVLDSSLEISANIASSGYAGMVQGAYTTGSEGMLRMDYLPTDAVIRNEDQVVTAGSTLYPRDLILGYVANAGFDETGVAKYALLTPAADFENMEQVFILTNYVNE
ncbi:MAG: rod shape-determining protein MreC [Candidatus Faecousia sp.]|nr:rod shape-determining protein MreC [Bacillota bacterium]MDY4220325.1 rod shape-determining protein MreC [Candidatus Faecousia sp.]